MKIGPLPQYGDSQGEKKQQHGIYLSLNLLSYGYSPKSLCMKCLQISCESRESFSNTYARVVCNNIINSSAHIFSILSQTSSFFECTHHFLLSSKFSFSIVPNQTYMTYLHKVSPLCWNLNKVLVYFMLLMLGFIKQKEKKTEAKNVQKRQMSESKTA